MFIIGIDVGKKGGISLIKVSRETKLIECSLYSDEELLRLSKTLPSFNTVAYVEKVHAMPNQGTVSMFNFGKSLGYILGVLESRGIKTVLVTPQEWKKEFGLINTNKKSSIEKAKSLFKEVNLYPSTRCRTESDGMAESLLIAYYGVKNEEIK